MSQLVRIIYPAYSLARVGVDKLIQKLDAIYNGEYSRVQRIPRYPKITLWDLLTHFLGEPTLIINNIYLGSAYNASDWYSLEERKITAVVNVSEELTNYFEKYIEYTRINILDNEEAQFGDFFEKAYIFIENCVENSIPILIHCYMGSSRSVSIIIYYLMKKHNKTLNEAILLVRSKRSIVNLNKVFYNELKKAETKL